MGNDLGMYYIMDAGGNYYKINMNNQLVVAEGMENATEFTFFDANQRIGGGKKSRFYQTVPADVRVATSEADVMYSRNVSTFNMGEDKLDNLEIIDKINFTSEKNFNDTVVGDKVNYENFSIENINWKSFMENFCKLVNSSKSYREEMEIELSQVDKEICDLMHYIELYDLNENEIKRAVEMIKDCRMRRRDIKDGIFCIENFIRYIGTESNVSKAKGFMSELKKLDTRIYHPRKFKELFEGMDGRKTNKNYRETNGKCIKSQKSDEKENRQGDDYMEYCRKETIFDSKKNDWVDFAKQQYDFYANVKQHLINLKLEVRAIDEIIESVMVEIEDAKYNVTQGYKAFKLLKDLRNERKEKLVDIKQLELIIGRVDCDSMLIAFQQVIEDMDDKRECNVENVCEMSEAV